MSPVYRLLEFPSSKRRRNPRGKASIKFTEIRLLGARSRPKRIHTKINKKKQANSEDIQDLNSLLFSLFRARTKKSPPRVFGHNS